MLLTLSQHFFRIFIYFLNSNLLRVLEMNCSHDRVMASGMNPFDKSYYYLQYEFDKKIMELLLTILNLNMTIVKTPLLTDLRDYERDPDSWVVQQIVNGTAEISSTTLILTPESSNLIDYSFGIGTYRPQLYYKVRSLREDYNIYLIPFSSKVWICLICVLLLLTLTLTFILSREVKLPHEISYDVFARLMDLQEDSDEKWTENMKFASKESLRQREKWEMGEILLVCLGAVCQQGSARDPSTSAARLLLLVLFLLAVVGYTAFSASIISLISLFPSTEREQSTLHLSNASGHSKPLLHNTRQIPQYLEEYTFTNFEFVDTQKGLDKATRGETEFIGDRDISLSFLHLKNYSIDTKCTLARIFLGVEYNKVFAMRNNSKLRNTINHNILRLRELGLLERERRRIFNTKPPCTFMERSTYSHFVSFDKNDVKPAKNIFQLGIIISILTLMIEYVIYYCPKEFKKFISKSSVNQKSQARVQKNLSESDDSKEDSESIKETTLLSKKILEPENSPRQPFLL